MTIIIPEWAMWLIVAFLFFNALGVGIDTVIRTKVNKILLKRNGE